MRLPNFRNQNEKGQALVLVVLVLFVMVAMAALMIDGGYTMLERRKAQAAADASALAGAGMLCSSQSSQAVNTAVSYATSNNASSASASVSGYTITVNVTVASAAFFSQIFGQSSLSSSATASASCFAPSQMSGTIPLTWLCTSPGANTAKDCQNHTVDWYTDMQSGQKLPSDSSKYTVFIFNDWVWPFPNPFLGQATCSPYGYLNCNLSGVATVFDSRTSGWINLAGGTWQDSSQLTNQMVSWINNGYSKMLQPGQYASSSVINMDSVYDAITVNKKVSGVYSPYILPVSNNVSFSNGWYYRRSGTFTVNGFSAFIVTCKDNFSAFDPPKCPGSKAFYNANSWWSFLVSYDTIEGYFVSNYPITGTSSGGLDAGLHVISLTP